MTAKAAMMAVVALALAGCGDRGGEDRACPPSGRSMLSGFCVPRWVSLKRGEVYGRKGPGKDYPALWIYRVQGLPVQVVAETTDWRRICDPDGGATWVHRSMIDGRRMVMAVGGAPIPLRRGPAVNAAANRLLNGRALALLGRCQGAWCKVKVGGVSGWVAANQVWGTAGPPQCR